MKVGVLALQGAFARHTAVLRALGAAPVEVRGPADLDGVVGLVVPGGESTTMSKLMETSGLLDAVAERLADGLAVLGTCAGMIMLAAEVLDGRADQHSLRALDIDVRRNGYGRQLESFEADVSVRGVQVPERPFPAVFIRAPIVERCGAGAEVLAQLDGRAVVVRARGRPIMACAFHPELSDDARLHELFLSTV